MKQTLIIFILLLTVIAKGYSCKCFNMNLQNEIDSADFIFQGTPIEKYQIGSKMIYKFTVEKVWKGDKIDTIEIKTGLGGPDCGMVFEISKTYVVYSENNLTTHCRRNALVDSTFDDLKLDYKLLAVFRETSFTTTDRKLTNNESDYLNQQFMDFTEKYDFNNKSIIFTSNRTIISKKDWFERFWDHDRPIAYIVELNEKERLETGYDAILVTYCKMMITDKMKAKILKQV